MSDERPEVAPTTAAASVGEPRSASTVLAMLGGIVALPLLVVVVLLLRDSGSGSAEAAVEAVREDRIQSVELTNGRVLFGALEASSGEWLLLRDAYFLRRTAPAASAADTADTAEAGTELVSIVAEQGGDGDVVVNAAELVSFQNLAKDSDIGGKIEDATR